MRKNHSYRHTFTWLVVKYFRVAGKTSLAGRGGLPSRICCDHRGLPGSCVWNVQPRTEEKCTCLPAPPKRQSRFHEYPPGLQWEVVGCQDCRRGGAGRPVCGTGDGLHPRREGVGRRGSDHSCGMMSSETLSVKGRARMDLSGGVSKNQTPRNTMSIEPGHCMGTCQPFP